MPILTTIDSTVLASWIKNDSITILSGMTKDGDRTGELIGQLSHDNQKTVILARGSWNGEKEPSVIIPGLTMSQAIRLGVTYRQESILHDGWMVKLTKDGYVLDMIESKNWFTARDTEVNPDNDARGFTSFLDHTGKEYFLVYEF